MTASELSEHLREVQLNGPGSVEINSVVYDSRRVGPGTLFCALPGEKVDGTTFIDGAIEAGAAGILCGERPRRVSLPWFTCVNPRRAMAEAAAAIAGWPSADLKVAAVTGTNGKTTTAFLIHALMKASQQRAGLVGTVQYDDGVDILKATHTTPEAPDLQALFLKMRENGCYGVAMEASSHALDQYRAYKVDFDAAIFTNLTQDHLDYHETMEAYFQAKQRLFDWAASNTGHKKPTAVINSDDSYGRRLAQSLEGTDVKVIRYGFGVAADLQAGDLRIDGNGTTFQLTAQGRQFLVKTPLIGRFNVYNCLAALGGAYGCGLNLREAVNNLANVPQVPGRLESVTEGSSRGFKVFVDYAHTPDALQKALETLRELKPRRLICVFGCGGDRDVTKRPKMGYISAQLADITVLTSDNPRSEDPETIIKDIRKGVGTKPVAIIPDREQAIQKAIESAQDGDIVLIAGKGHEDYQIFADKTIEFDDRRVAASAIRRKPGLKPEVGDTSLRIASYQPKS